MNGYLLVDKPGSISSNQVLSVLKRKIHIKKLGHTGTLDPFATGLLVVGIGEALKYISYLNEEPKVYEATLQLGIETDTLDLLGKVVKEKDVPDITRQSINDVFKSLLGEQDQIPPMFSAKKIEGKKLYELARQGMEVERKPVKIRIDQLELVEWSHNQTFKFQVACTKGTYVRVLGQTIAKKLGTVGHLISLRRTKAGFFDIKDSASLDENIIGAQGLVPLALALSHHFRVDVSIEDKENLKQGRPIVRAHCHASLSKTQFVALFYDDKFIGMGEVSGNQLQPKRMIAN